MADKITDRIWIGNSWDAANPPCECNAILNCAFDLFSMVGWNRHIHLSQCGLIDGPGNPVSAYRSAVLQLDALCEHGKTVLVHCHKGHSRSVAVVMGFLNMKDNRGWDYWRDYVRLKRREIPDNTPHPAMRELFEAAWKLSATTVV